MSERPAVLVTGGAGYIGAHACKRLAEAGFSPICYDSLETGHREFVRWGRFVFGDIRDQTKVTETLRQHNVVAVMHFAAFSLVGESVADPQKYYQNNLFGTLTLLAAMREAGCNRLVVSSTGAVYGDVPSGLVSEERECKPINPYGASKWMIERLLADYDSAYGLTSFCLRYFNACGADESGSIGEMRKSETHLIPRAMMAIQGHLADFAIFGDDYPTPDGTAIRDYIHVTDLADAHVSALRLLLKGRKGGSFNLGTGSGFSVRQVLAAIAAETGREVPRAVRRRRLGDPAELVADPSRARETLGFSPACSDLRTIVRSAWTWHQKAHPLKS
jgi:UDP-glucose-4-epimerase GalE